MERPHQARVSPYTESINKDMQRRKEGTSWRTKMSDLIVVNGDVRTCEARKPRASAFAVEDGKIVAVGNTDLIMEMYTNDNTMIVDAKGKTVIPGLVDAHTHLHMGMELFSPNSVDLMNVEDTAEWLRLMKKACEVFSKDDENAWLVGGRWDEFLLKEGDLFPTLDQLDEVIPSHVAMCLLDIDCHSVWTNRRGLELAGIDKDTPQPIGGEICRDENGELTGVIKEMSFLILDSKAFKARTLYRNEKDQMLDTFRHFNSFGVTSCHEMPLFLEFYKMLLNEGEPLTMRLWCGSLNFDASVINDEFLDRLVDLKNEMNSAAQRLESSWKCGPMFRIGYVKLFIDGTMANYTAAFWDEYSDRPGFKFVPFMDQERLNEIVTKAFEHRFPVSIHAIGDRGVSMAIEALGKSPNPHGCSKRVEHMELLRESDIKLLAKYKITASMQPTHCTAGSYQIARLGAKRLSRSYPWQKIATTGTEIAFGSDWPTALESPLQHLEDAVLRMKAGKPYDPQNRLSFDEALYSHTQVGANLAGWGNEIGSISVGKWADFVILPTKVDGEDLQTHSIKDLKAEQTWIAGRLVYSKP